jgi:nucleoside-diphosphate-sugar epimerase
MSNPNSKKTVAFFGATGGVCNTTLAHALKAGHHCTTLARTPQKLHDMLRTAQNVPSETLDKYLTIHKGDSKDISAISAVLKDPQSEGHLVDTIVFGMGSYPKFQWSLFQPITLENVNICEEGTTSIFAALDALANQGVTVSRSGAKPLFISISTTGISDKARDVPMLLYPLYHWTLQVPHLDKKLAEELLINDNGKHIRDCVIVRPTLLNDSAPKGLEALRVGWEWKGKEAEKGGVKEVGPQLGWGVGRKDVGGFVWKAVLDKEWEGRCVSLTY